MQIKDSYENFLADDFIKNMANKSKILQRKYIVSMLKKYKENQKELNLATFKNIVLSHGGCKYPHMHYGKELGCIDLMLIQINNKIK